jgi:hypothetical protein
MIAEISPRPVTVLNVNSKPIYRIIYGRTPIKSHFECHYNVPVPGTL